MYMLTGKGPTKKKVNGDTTLDHVDQDDDATATGKQPEGAVSSDEEKLQVESDRDGKVKVNDVEMAVDDEKVTASETNNGNLNHGS